MTDLKPCPFCGGEAEFYEDKGGFSVYCDFCGVGVDYYSKGLDDAKQQAADAWNRRSPEIVHCRDCVHFRRQTSTDRARCNGVFVFIEPDEDGFCSWGKKVEDAD